MSQTIASPPKAVKDGEAVRSALKRRASSGRHGSAQNSPSRAAEAVEIKVDQWRNLKEKKLPVDERSTAKAGAAVRPKFESLENEQFEENGGVVMHQKTSERVNEGRAVAAAKGARDEVGRLLQKYVSSWNSTVMSEAHVPVQTVQSKHGDEPAMEIQREIGTEALDKRVPSLKGIRSLKPSNKNFLMYDHEQLESGKKRAQNLIHQIANS